MEFVFQNRRHVLRGASSGNFHTAKKKQLSKSLSSGVHLAMLQLSKVPESVMHSLTTHAEQAALCPAITKLMSAFEDIFGVPSGLPPCRPGFDHRIPLEQGTNPINQRPYRYGKQQKDEIDIIVKEYLKSGVIQPSESLFASPVVLVGKKDGSWRLCVDYRELNKRTIKNKFPIPLVEDLMDELHGSVIFSKIDLRAGYNQVRMSTDDIYKTTFRTHSGHFEYLVMPFGLTNAPTTFQSLKNTIFQEFLRKFVLVFFDDIIVYSASVSDHVNHLE